MVGGADPQGGQLRAGGADARRPVGELTHPDRAHDHSDHHHHGPSRETERGALKAALVLIVAFMLVEVTAGVLASSLALLSDAAHMLTDAVALALSLVAARLAARPAGGA